jgi:hypothetical protein
LADQLTFPCVIVRDEEIVSCDLADGAALLDLRSGTYFSVNPVGAYIWELLEEPVAFADIHAALMARYDVGADECYDDLKGLLDELAAAQLIRVVDGVAR